MSTYAERLRVSRSTLIANLLQIERKLFAQAAIDIANAQSSRGKKSEKYQLLLKNRTEALRLIRERDDYIVQAFAESLPARLRKDLHP
jgi:hypothetical protein